MKSKHLVLLIIVMGCMYTSVQAQNNAALADHARKGSTTQCSAVHSKHIVWVKQQYVHPLCGVCPGRELTVYLNPKDSSMTLCFWHSGYDQYEHDFLMYVPGYPEHVKDFLDSQCAAQRIKEIAQDKLTSPELFFCNGYCTLDCMNVGKIFYRCYSQSTGEELLYLITDKVMPAQKLRKNFFQFQNNVDTALKQPE